jgi:hypothetical protein
MFLWGTLKLILLLQLIIRVGTPAFLVRHAMWNRWKGLRILFVAVREAAGDSGKDTRSDLTNTSLARG